MTGKFSSMSAAKKTLLGVGGFFVLIAAIGSTTNPNPDATPASDKREFVQSASQVNEAEQPKKPIVEIKTVEEAVAMPFESTTQNDPTLASGKTILATSGVNGEKIISYKVTYTDGAETSREQSGERVSKAPVTQVTKVGTKVAAAPKPAASCHASYTGACVPIGVSDVDCAGGSGNGPFYVGTVSVVGYDEYGLDKDGDGVACE